MNTNTLQLFDNTNINELSINLNFDINLSAKSYQTFNWKYNNYNTKKTKPTKEKYKDIKEYEGQYQISNKGNIKSLKKNKEFILSPIIDKKGYHKISLYKEGKEKKFYIHRLVFQMFNYQIPDGKNLVVDHIDNDKTNNELDNLQVISNRENLSKDKWRYNPSSLYTGVCFHTTKRKWESSIFVNGNSFHLGYFRDETIAAQEYKNALEYYNKHSDLTNYPFKTKRINEVFSININQLTINFTQYC